MGQELECSVIHGGKTLTGTAHLETDFVLFRGEERLKVMFKNLTGVSAAKGKLKLEFDGGPATFELGDAAEKWAHKILHPPSLLDKLGVKAGLDLAVVGDFDSTFVKEIGATTKGKADLLFFAAQKAVELKRLAALIARLKPRGAVWVVYPKGVPEIREIEVIDAGRAAGLKDTKVARFSATHTALRFSLPAK